jgi:hypothetical protein
LQFSVVLNSSSPPFETLKCLDHVNAILKKYLINKYLTKSPVLHRFKTITKLTARKYKEPALPNLTLHITGGGGGAFSLGPPQKNIEYGISFKTQ